MTIRFTARSVQIKHKGLLHARVVNVIWFILINCLMIQPFLQRIFEPFSYLDEGAAIGLGLLAAAKSISHPKKSLTATDRTLILFLITFLMIGGLGNLFGPVRLSLAPIAIDIVACSKFFIALLSGFILFDEAADLLDSLRMEARVLLVILFILGVANLFFDFGMGGDGDFGIPRAFKFIFYHQAALVWFVVALVSLLLSEFDRNRIYILFGFVVIALTLTTKGVCWVAAIMMIVVTLNKRGRPSVFGLLFGGIAVLMLASDSLILYYANSTVDTARSALQQAANKIALNEFPFGAGFASFGSAVTAMPEHYSPLYFAYGLSTIWGLTPGNTQYLSDTFWPVVIGQFGYVGFAVFAAVAFFCFRSVIVRTRDSGNARAWLSPISLLIYLVLGSLAETAFFNPSAVYFAILIAMQVVATHPLPLSGREFRSVSDKKDDLIEGIA